MKVQEDLIEAVDPLLPSCQVEIFVRKVQGHQRQHQQRMKDSTVLKRAMEVIGLVKDVVERVLVEGEAWACASEEGFPSADSRKDNAPVLIMVV